MYASPTSVSAATRLSSFAAASLWHRRLARATLASPRVRPRVSAELILHPVVSNGLPVATASTSPRAPLDVYRAA